MKCPRCGNELDATKGACASCGYVIRLTGQSGGSAWPAPHSFQHGNPQPGVLSGERQISGDSPNPWRQSASPSPVRQPSDDLPNPWRQSGGLPPLAPQPIEKNPPLKKEIDSWQSAQPARVPGTDALSMNNSVPLTPPVMPSFESSPSTGTLRHDQGRRQSQPLPPLSTSDPFTRDRQQMNTPRPAAIAQQQSNPNVPAVMKPNTRPLNAGPLLPGVLLRGGRYRLQEMLRRQDWIPGVFEATWIGKDAQRNGSQVMICELVLPDKASATTQSILRTATTSLASIGRHPHIPALWDAFSDQDRSFFVFEPIEGESLLSRLHRSGRGVPEDEIIECCLQMTEVLELLAQQNPPTVHGLIRPEHIILARSSAQFVLINFSVVLAGGAIQFVTGMDRALLSPYTASEFVRGVIDVRTDMYSLLATAYHVATGSIPNAINGNIIPARQVNNNLSTEFDAILTKGLRANPGQRYQRPSELRQDLLAARAANKMPAAGSSRERLVYSFPVNSQPLNDARNGQSAQPVLQRPDPVAEPLPDLLIPGRDDKGKQPALPRQENLPQATESNFMRNISIFFALFIVALIIAAVLSQIMHP
ncbi:MAG TPA: protein kinase [Ktedonobacteraceae bacterium]|nr:protein kinase [Ktedonobacteraceae bacterium]